MSDRRDCPECDCRECADCLCSFFHAERDSLRTRIAKLEREVAGMRAVYEAAHRWAVYGRDDNDDEQRLLQAVRASGRAALDDLVELTEEYGGYAELDSTKEDPQP